VSQRSFGIVDDKIIEADFFLEKLRDAGLNFLEARCCFSAFVSASRSITFALQSVMNEVQGFDTWYDQQQKNLKADPTARYFQRARTVLQHVGENPMSGGATFRDDEGRLCVKYFFNPSDQDNHEEVPDCDVATACKTYLVLLLDLMKDCYRQFGPLIDPDQYYTLDNLRSLHISIEDVEEELGFPRGWTQVSGGSDEERLGALRRQISPSPIHTILEKYGIA
jgi:hypothetical protein